MLVIHFTNGLHGGELSHTRHVLTSDEGIDVMTSDEGIEQKSTSDVLFAIIMKHQSFNNLFWCYVFSLHLFFLSQRCIIYCMNYR